jgi:hypothetical protein
MYQFSHSGYGGTATSYSVLSGSATLQPNGINCYITTSGGATVCATVTNTCGAGAPYCFYVPGASSFKAFPNPAKNLVTVDIESLQKQDGELFLYSEKDPKHPVKTVALNDAIKNRQGGKITIDVSELPRGTYFLRYVLKERDSQNSMRIVLN